MDQNKISPNVLLKPSKWRYVFIILTVLQILGIAGFFTTMQSAIEVGQSGASGSEFIGLIALAMIPFLGLLALINLIGLTVYIIKRTPHSVVGWISAMASLLLSAALVVCGAYMVYQMRIAIPIQENLVEQQHDKEFKEAADRFAKDNANPEITKDAAITLLKTCQLSGFYYTNQKDRDDGNWGSLSSTGVVLTKIDGKPFRISIADGLISELLPIAREAQKTCGGAPQFWHDGSYE
jgi:hypothetical protein